MTCRIRKPYGLCKEEAWERLQTLLQNPQTTKEIWIIVGNMLSVSKMRESLKRNAPEPEAIQLNHLLETTIAAATTIGAHLRVLCMP